MLQAQVTFYFGTKTYFVKKKTIIGFKSFVLKAQCYMFYYHNSKDIVVRTELVICRKRSVTQWIQLHPFMILLTQIFSI